MNQAAEKFTPARIQYLLKEAGITQKQIAQEEGKSEMVISDVINFKMVSRPMMEAIARRIGFDHRVVFAWYFEQKICKRPEQKRRRRPSKLAH